MTAHTFHDVLATVWLHHSKGHDYTAISEAVGTAAPIDLRFLHPGGERTGRPPPIGPRTWLSDAEVETSVVDIANPW